MFQKDQPLWLPQGSIQGLIALIVAGTFAYLAVTGKIDPKDVMQVVMVVFGFYFLVKSIAAATLAATNGGNGKP